MEAWMEDGDKVLVPEAYKGEVGSHGVIDGRCFKWLYQKRTQEKVEALEESSKDKFKPVAVNEYV